MNGAQLHLALNHIPVILSMAAPAVLLWGWLSKSSEIKKVGLALVVAAALFAGAAYLTGEPAEEVLEKLPIFSKELTHEHEEAGEAALIVSMVAGVAALAALYLAKKKPKFSFYAFVVTLIVVAMSSLAFLNTAHLGGMVRHEEIRPQNTH